jgi:hypothetical protein
MENLGGTVGVTIETGSPAAAVIFHAKARRREEGSRRGAEVAERKRRASRSEALDVHRI